MARAERRGLVREGVLPSRARAMGEFLDELLLATGTGGSVGTGETVRTGETVGRGGQFGSGRVAGGVGPGGPEGVGSGGPEGVGSGEVGVNRQPP
ncbi:hypothetical protein [Streptomyces phaeoluteigriseus]|uniref:hypothetical protein n=1 Tax=Streptomyces phaeoluteigriseus TaxID=114686 RepID=UPI00117E1BD3|nr:hypothetical protein [Streptomyces phaeoluteigriseus]